LVCFWVFFFSLPGGGGGVFYYGFCPAAGENGPAVRRDMQAAWRRADKWIGKLRAQMPQ
jgi:hypothetical protein